MCLGHRQTYCNILVRSNKWVNDWMNISFNTMYLSLCGCRVKCPLGCGPNSWCVSQPAVLFAPLEKKKKNPTAVCDILPLIYTVTSAMLGITDTLLQPCIDMTPPYTDRNTEGLCNTYIKIQFFNQNSIQASLNLYLCSPGSIHSLLN